MCTDNAAKIYDAHRSGVGSSSTTNSPFYMKYIGTEQSIMGSKKEIEGTKEVISKMEEYLMNEVFAKPEYAAVRNKCNNEHKLCAFWSSVGECDNNRSYMISHCAAACRLCLQSALVQV